MITFKMRREGQFVANFNTTKNQCGSVGQQVYRYVCEIEVGESLDNRGFILDNYRVQGYFDRTYAQPQIALSCEWIADIAVGDFRTMLEEQGREIHAVSVTISGSDVASLTASWKKETPAAPSDGDDLGIADVWHRGTKSYYRARLLKKLTLAEAFFDPTEDEDDSKPVETVKIDLAAIEKRVIEMNQLPFVCDFCHVPVESDNEQMFKDNSQWIHKDGFYMCRPFSRDTIAMVNGSENVSGEPPQFEEHDFPLYTHNGIRVCRKCHKSDVYCDATKAKCVLKEVPSAKHNAR